MTILVARHSHIFISCAIKSRFSVVKGCRSLNEDQIVCYLTLPKPALKYILKHKSSDLI